MNKKKIYIISTLVLFFIIGIILFILYKKPPSAEWEIKDISYVFPPGVRCYFVVDNKEEFFKHLNSKGMIDTLKKIGFVSDLVSYLGLPYNISKNIEEMGLEKIFGERFGMGFYRHGVIFVIQHSPGILNLFSKAFKTNKIHKGIPYLKISKDYNFLIIEKYLIFCKNESLMVDLISHLKAKEEPKIKRITKENLPEGTLIYGEYLVKNKLINFDDFIFYYIPEKGFVLKIKKIKGILGKMIKHAEGNLKKEVMIPDGLVYISVGNLNLKEGMKDFIKNVSKENIYRRFLLKNKIDKIANLLDKTEIGIVFKNFEINKGFIKPLFLIKVKAKDSRFEKRFEKILKGFLRKEVKKMEGKRGIYSYYFYNINGKEVIGYFRKGEDVYITSSLSLLRDEIRILSDEGIKKTFPQVNDLFLYFNGIIFKEFIKKICDTLLSKRRDIEKWAINKKILPLIKALNVAHLHGQIKYKKNEVELIFK